MCINIQDNKMDTSEINELTGKYSDEEIKEAVISMKKEFEEGLSGEEVDEFIVKTKKDQEEGSKEWLKLHRDEVYYYDNSTDNRYLHIKDNSIEIWFNDKLLINGKRYKFNDFIRYIDLKNKINNRNMYISFAIMPCYQPMIYIDFRLLSRYISKFGKVLYLSSFNKYIECFDKISNYCPSCDVKLDKINFIGKFEIDYYSGPLEFQGCSGLNWKFVSKNNVKIRVPIKQTFHKTIK